MSAGRFVPSSRQARWIIGIAFGTALAGAVPFLGARPLVATFYYYDDNFYYFQIARNLAAGRGFTFDGIHSTNGFHPLWQVALVPVFAAFPGDVLPLRAVAFLETGLIILAGMAIFGILRPRLGPTAAIAAALLVVAQPGSARVLRAGMESSVFLLALVLVWRQWLSMRYTEPAPLRGWLRLGGLSALAFLARLEAAVLLPTLLFLGRKRLKANHRATVALVTPMLVCGGLYLAWNRIAFASWLPVSALVKASWLPDTPGILGFSGQPPAVVPIPSVLEAALQRLVGQPVAGSVWASTTWVLSAFGLLAGWWRRRFVGVVVRRSGAPFLLLFCAQFIVLHVLVVGRIESWQRVPLMLTSSVLAGALLFRSRQMERVVVAVSLAAILARVPLTAWHASQVDKRPTGGAILKMLDAAEWLRANTAHSDRIASWSSAGTIGYFSHRPVVNLDGVVNDLNFFNSVVRDGRLAGYLRSEGIRFLVDRACGPNPDLRDALPEILRSRSMLRSRANADELLRNRFDLVRAFYDARARDGCPGLAVWEAHWDDNPDPRRSTRPRSLEDDRQFPSDVCILLIHSC